jgi:hypothetical protein
MGDIRFCIAVVPTEAVSIYYNYQRLNMESDLQSLFGLLCTSVLIGWDPSRTSPTPPAFGLLYEGSIGQPRQTTSLCNPLILTHGSAKRCRLYLG